MTEQSIQQYIDQCVKNNKIMLFQNRDIVDDLFQNLFFIVPGKMKCNTEEVPPPKHGSNGKYVIVLKISWIVQYKPW